MFFYVFLQENDRLHKRPAARQNHCHGLCTGDSGGSFASEASGIRKGRGSFIDSLFTSTSAVCVTGLIAVDTADHFTVFGRTVVALLIQIGGLGVTSVGVGFILMAGKRIGLKGRKLVREAMNVDTSKGMVRLVKNVLLMTLCF